MTPARQTILLVDPHRPFRDATRQALGARGYGVREVDTVEEALSLLAREDVHAILSEIHLEGMEGHAILRMVAQQPGAPPVVVVTASTDLDDAIEALRRRAFDYLVKPVPMDRLLDVVDRAVARASPVGPVTPGSGAWTPAHAAAPAPALATVGAGPTFHGACPSPAGAHAAAVDGAPYTSTASVVSRVVSDLQSGRLQLPAADPRVGELQRLLGDVDAGGEEVLRIVGRDGALTTAILRAANTAAAGGGRRIMNLREACVRLGNRRVYTVLLEVLMSNSLSTRKEPFARILAGAWKNAALTARIAENFARQLSIPDADELLAPALLHNVGEHVILLALCDPAVGVHASSPDTLAGVVNDIAAAHEELGGLALRTWGLDARAARLAEYHHRPAMAEDAGAARARELVVAGWALARLSGANYLPDGRADLVDLIAPLGLNASQVAKALTDAKAAVGG